MKNHHQVLTALAGAVLFTSSHALATDDKGYPGSVCRPTGGGAYSLNGIGVFNTGATPMSISCPVVRDGSSVASAIVKVLDRNPNEDLSCIVVAEIASGTFFVSDESPAVGSGTTFASSNVTTLTLPAVSLTSFSGTYDYLECTIPSVFSGNFSHLISITVKEN